ncbi:MAG: DNA translocase FtsK 4TM domain-containing protein, partial [Bacteroidales bacterium]|nr:DNA translocase FtsK 4TM domain-containing protein [Bacteroidales bacterium]
MAENKNRLRVAPTAQESHKEPKKQTLANTSKSKTTKKSTSKVAKRRKESDGRVRICFGIFFFLVSIFTLVAFASPYFGYDTNGKWLTITGNFMSKNMFGIGTVYIIFLVGLFGLHLLSKKISVKSWTLWKYSIVFLLWIPLVLALIFKAMPSNEISQYEIYFGLIGNKCYTFLYQYIGVIGIILLLIFTAFIYVIFTFNINFDFLKKKERPETNDDNEENETTESEEEEEEEEE